MIDPGDVEDVGGDEPLLLPNEKEVLRLYYEGAQLPSPVGGFLELIHVQPQEDGSGFALFECLASSLRYRMPIKKATRTERKKVSDMIDAGVDPDCPRHVDRRLTRVGRNLVCPACGVRYARV